MAATVVLYIQLMRDRNFNNFSTVMSEASDTFVDVADTTALFAKFADVSAMLLLVSWLKVFKYLRINRKLTVLWDTMRNAMQEILSLAIVFGWSMRRTHLRGAHRRKSTRKLPTG